MVRIGRYGVKFGRYMNHPTSLVARNLQSMRESRGLSLGKLAELTGISKSMLRQIEIGQSSPTIATLWKIANGLHVPFSSLLEHREQAVSIRSFRAEEPLQGDAEGYRLYPLVLFDPQRPFEIYYLELEPGVRHRAEPHEGNASEQVFVLQGVIDITVDETRHQISRDHFITFDASVPHVYENADSSPATAFVHISYRP